MAKNVINIDELNGILSSNGFSIVEKIGEGCSSRCFKIFSHQYREYFACKVLPITEERSARNIFNFQQELDMLCKIIHPSIIQVYKTIVTPNYDILILDYCPNGDLHRHIMKYGPITDSSILLTLIYKILSALTYLESIKVSHHDIKPSNILLDKYNRPKLCDFGASRKGIQPNTLTKDFVGTLIFESPELLSKRAFNPILSDIWSFGVTVYFLATGTFPFVCSNFEDFKSHVMTGAYYLPKSIDSTVQTIIKSTLQVSPEKRLSFKELKAIVEKALAELPPVPDPLASQPKILPIRNSSGVNSFPIQNKRKIIRPKNPRRFSSFAYLGQA